MARAFNEKWFLTTRIEVRTELIHHDDDEDTSAQVAPIVKLGEVAVTTGEEDENGNRSFTDSTRTGINGRSEIHWPPNLQFKLGHLSIAEDRQAYLNFDACGPHWNLIALIAV
ncbi:hypothetical protein PIB30_064449, partial [Stylosanthes scabra]|nr:hypothetical protein [Stylosanthes scabra]